MLHMVEFTLLLAEYEPLANMPEGVVSSSNS